MEEPKKEEVVVTDVVTPATEEPKIEEKSVEPVNYDEELKVLEAEEATKKEAARKGFEMRKARKLPKKEIEEEIEEEEPEAEPEDIDDVIDTKVNQRVAEIFVDDIIESVSKNPAEQKLIRLTYNTRIVKSGFTREAIRRDVSEAYAIANRKRLELQNKELKLATETKAGNGMGAGGDSPSPKEDVRTTVFSKEQIAGWKAQGFDDAKIAKIKENFQKSKFAFTVPASVPRK